MVLGELTDTEVKSKSLEYHFAVNTSCHGLKNVALAKHLPVRIFWIIAILLAFGALVSQIVMLTMQYASFSAVTEVKVMNQKKMAFPAVTVCNYNRVMKSKLEKVAGKANVNVEDLQSYITLGFGDFTWIWSVDNFTAEVERNKEAMIQVRDKLRSSGYLKYTDLIDDTSYDLDQLLTPEARCTWSGLPNLLTDELDACPLELFTPVVTRFGRCFTINSDFPETLYQEKPGVGNGFRVWVNIHQDEYSENFMFGNSEEGIRVLVHHKKEFPVMETQGLAISPGVHGYVGIDWTKYIYAEPQWGDCKVENLTYHQRYSSEACKLECYVRYIQDKCGCRPVSLPGDVARPVCEPLDMIQCVRDAETLYYLEEEPCGFECNPPCRRDEYPVTFSSAVITSRHIEHRLARVFNVTASYFRQNLIYLDLYFQKMSYMFIHQKPGTTFSQLLGNIGGQLGLFIGASVITISEVVEFLIMKCVFWNVERRKRKQAEKEEPHNAETLQLKQNPAP